MKEMEKIRKRQEKIDEELLSLIEKRAELSREIAELKTGKEKPSLDFSTYKTDLARLEQKARGAFPPDMLRRIFVEIISGCRKLEFPVKVGFLGPEGTFTHQAAITEFGSGVELVPFPSVDDLFSAVEKKHVDFSVVAIENSTGGVVHSVLDRFLDSDAKIASEIIIYINLCLISEAPLSKIKRIFSHPQPFMQCRRWLRSNLPGAKHVEVASTVEGIKRAKEAPDGAAIGSEIAAPLYDMNVAASNIQDSSENYTRFVVLGRSLSPPSGSDKTSLIMSIKHQPGSLFEAIKPFAETAINLTKIESRPTRQRPWEYVFFIDFEGHAEDEKVQNVLEKLKPHTVFVKLLGSYPRERTKK